LDALGGFPPPGFDLEETASSTNIEIHFVDSSGVIHWKFLGDEPDFPFVDWNFSTTTAEDYAWAVERLHKDGSDIYVADFTHLGVYACRILVPGKSEIYPVDDLDFENNSVGNSIREAILNLNDLDDEECTDLLDTLNESALADQRPVAAVIGMAADAGSFWSDLRVGELKTLLALAIGDEPPRWKAASGSSTLTSSTPNAAACTPVSKPSSTWPISATAGRTCTRCASCTVQAPSNRLMRSSCKRTASWASRHRA